MAEIRELLARRAEEHPASVDWFEGVQKKVRSRHRRRRIEAVATAVGVLVVPAILLWSAFGPTPPHEQPAATKRLPPIGGRTLTGGHVTPASYRGSVLVLNLWGTWCGPCRTQQQQLLNAEKALAGREVVFIGIDEKDNPKAARSWLRTFGVDYPVISDTEGSLGHKLDIIGVPTTLIVDERGIIRNTLTGSAANAQEIVTSVLKAFLPQGPSGVSTASSSQTIRDIGMLGPPLAGVTPAVSAQDAYEKAMDESPSAFTSADETFGSFVSSSYTSHNDTPGAPEINGIAVWVVALHDDCPPIIGGITQPPSPAGPCTGTWYVIVDATSGQVLESGN